MLAELLPCASKAFMEALSESRISEDSLPEHTFLIAFFFSDAYLGTFSRSGGSEHDLAVCAESISPCVPLSSLSVGTPVHRVVD